MPAIGLGQLHRIHGGAVLHQGYRHAVRQICRSHAAPVLLHREGDGLGVGDAGVAVLGHLESAGHRDLKDLVLGVTLIVQLAAGHHQGHVGPQGVPVGGVVRSHLVVGQAGIGVRLAVEDHPGCGAEGLPGGAVLPQILQLQNDVGGHVAGIGDPLFIRLHLGSIHGVGHRQRGAVLGVGHCVAAVVALAVLQPLVGVAAIGPARRQLCGPILARD